MSATAPSSTTLGADLRRDGNVVTVASSTGMSAGQVLIVGAEVVTILEVVSATVLRVQRGRFGSAARAHNTGSTAYFGSPTAFLFRGGRALVSGGVDSELPDFPLPVGTRVVDPNTGYEYLVVDCQSSFIVGEWVVIDANGLASQLAATSKGRIGIIVETIGASDTLSLALVVGAFSSALFVSGATTSGFLQAGTGAPDALTSTDANVIYGATCTGAPSTATSPAVGGGVGTAYINDPWCDGVVSQPQNS